MAINSNVCSHFFHFRPDDDWSIQSKRQQSYFPSSNWQQITFSLFKAVCVVQLISKADSRMRSCAYYYWQHLTVILHAPFQASLTLLTFWRNKHHLEYVVATQKQPVKKIVATAGAVSDQRNNGTWNLGFINSISKGQSSLTFHQLNSLSNATDIKSLFPISILQLKTEKESNYAEDDIHIASFPGLQS